MRARAAARRLRTSRELLVWPTKESVDQFANVNGSAGKSGPSLTSGEEPRESFSLHAGLCGCRCESGAQLEESRSVVLCESGDLFEQQLAAGWHADADDHDQRAGAGRATALKHRAGPPARAEDVEGDDRVAEKHAVLRRAFQTGSDGSSGRISAGRHDAVAARCRHGRVAAARAQSDRALC